MRILWILTTAILAFSMHCLNASTSEDFGSVVFTDSALQMHLNQCLSRYVYGSSAIAFVDKFIRAHPSFALVIYSHVREFHLKDTSIPILILNLAAAALPDDHTALRQVNSGLWVRNLRTGQEYQLASRQETLFIPNDLEVFHNDPVEFQQLTSAGDEMPPFPPLCFISVEGKQERLIYVTGFMSEHGEKAPTKRSKLFAELDEARKRLVTPSWVDEVERFLENNR